MSESLQYRIRGRDAASVARSIEQGVLRGALEPGEALPSVRALAKQLSLSPTTVASAYRDLRQRGVLVAHDRSRTTVAHRPPLAVRLVPTLPADALDLATGNPDPQLLPDLGPGLRAVGPVHRLYGEHPIVDSLAERAHEDFAADGIDSENLAIVGGALDGIERVLEVHCRVGDRVAVEDPGYIGTLDLVRALGLEPVPMAVDDEGPRPDDLDAALRSGVAAVLVVPRAQNPTGAAWTATRVAALRAVLAEHPEPLIIEDDAAAGIAGRPWHSLTPEREQWAVVRSVAKALGPDLRVAALVGDADTVTRVQGRQRLGTGWVSHLLQRLAATVWNTAIADGTLERAAAAYTERRTALLEALADHVIVAHGASGLNVWIPVVEEVPVVQALAARGWAVQAGEPFRIISEPGIRVTVAALEADAARAFADDLADVFGASVSTRRG
ncbi:MAG: aminotransferase class I/II-fold pyridoxal phosphate-dependent enzyme [Nitriliruptoraceae bacterium]